MSYSWPGNVRELKNVVERLVVRARSGTIMPGDLSKEVLTAWSRTALPAAVATSKSISDRLYERMTVEGESFWSVVCEPFMSRDITRDDLRAVITRGLEHTKGSYKQLLQVFNIAPEDYKRLLSFLRKYGCHMPFQKFRTIPVRPEALVFRREAGADERFVKTG